MSRSIMGNFGDGHAGNHLHCYGQQKLTAKSIKPKQKNPKYNNTLPMHARTQT